MSEEDKGPTKLTVAEFKELLASSRKEATPPPPTPKKDNRNSGVPRNMFAGLPLTNTNVHIESLIVNYTSEDIISWLAANLKIAEEKKSLSLGLGASNEVRRVAAKMARECCCAARWRSTIGGYLFGGSSSRWPRRPGCAAGGHGESSQSVYFLVLVLGCEHKLPMVSYDPLVVSC